MILSGFYKPKFSDIYKAIIVLCIVAAFAQSLNFILDGSNADFMTLRYGNGNPFQFLLTGPAPILYYLVLAAICFSGTALVISLTILIKKLVTKKANQ